MIYNHIINIARLRYLTYTYKASAGIFYRSLRVGRRLFGSFWALQFLVDAGWCSWLPDNCNWCWTSAHLRPGEPSFPWDQTWDRHWSIWFSNPKKMIRSRNPTRKDVGKECFSIAPPCKWPAAPKRSTLASSDFTQQNVGIYFHNITVTV